MAAAPAAPDQPSATSVQPPLGQTAALGIVIGAANALGLLGFEWLTEHLIELIWSDWSDSDEVRWLVLPLAIVAGILLSVAVRATRQARMQPAHTDVLAGLDEVRPSSLRLIGVLLAVGAASLVAGASLGPEGAVLPASVALGAWAAGRTDAPGPMGQIFVLSSIGALLVSFFNSLLPVLIPPLLLHRKGTPLSSRSVVPPVLAGLAAWVIVFLIRGQTQGPDIVPVSSGGDLSAVLVALVLGMLVVPVGVLLRLMVREMSRLTERWDRTWHWIAAAAMFGAVLGGLYLIGGESVQFSGREGTHLLYEDRAQHGVAAFLGLLLVKLLATAWSISAGYRGGVAFPAVYAGVALGLAVTAALPGVSETGAMIGGVAGILAEVTSPAIALIMLLALMPLELLPIGLAGAIGAVAGRRALERLMPRLALKPEPGE